MTTDHLEVAGETHYAASFRKLFKGVPTGDYGGAEMHLEASLLAAPDNPFDPNAVAVFVSGLHVGYLAASEARIYSGPLQQLQAAGRVLGVDARVWCSTADNRTSARVTLRVPPMNGLVPANAMPTDPYVVLPTGSTIQVTKEEEHMDVLGPMVSAGTDIPVAVTLRSIHDIRARSAVETVEVAIDGHAVGVLSAAQAGNMLPIVKHLASLLLTPVARATLKGNALKAEVILHVAKSHDLDQAWIESLGMGDGVRSVPRQDIDGRNG